MSETNVYSRESIKIGLKNFYGFDDFKSNAQADAVLSILNGMFLFT